MTYDRPRVDVAVVTWNTAAVTPGALRRVLDSTPECDLRVLVRDNASTDGTAGAIAAAVPEAVVDAGDENLGFAAGMNVLLARSDAPWVLALNPDAWPEPGAVARLVERAVAEPSAAAVAPLLLRPDGDVEHSTHPFPSLRVAAASALGLAGRAGERLLLEGAWRQDEARRVDWAVGAALLMRRDAIDDVGGFDESFWLYAEDLEWCSRAARHGWEIWFDPCAVVRHVGNVSGAQRYGDARSDAVIAATLRFYRRHHGAASTAAFRALNAAGAARLSMLGTLRRDDGMARYWRRQARAHVGLVPVRAEPPSRDEPMTIIGSFAVLEHRDDLDTFVVDGEVLDTNLFLGRRCPSEQTALSLYRVARARGWHDVATELADWTQRRVVDADGLPVHDLLGHRETHTRFLADAALLLEADGRIDAARLVHDRLEALAAPGPWYRHDTIEAAAGENQLVLNTHVHTLVARAASGLAIDDGVRELERVLTLPGETRAPLQAAAIAASDLLRAAPWPVVRERGWRLAERAHHSASRSRVRRPHLALPGGWIARDVLATPTPSYLTVNLSDLAVLARLVPSPVVTRALHRGIRWARATGYFRAQRLAGDPLVVLVPGLLRNAGTPAAASRAAGVLRAAGIAPTIGWPGYEDALWPRLPSGTP